MRMILAAGFGLLGIAAAEAASFDCDKAATPFEKQICSNPDLSRKDEVLAKAWATAIGGLSEDAKAEMQADQRAWLDYVPLSCTTDAKMPRSYTDDQQSCLVSAFASRISDLEASRMLGGWRFYLKEHWAVMDDPDPDWWGGVSTKHFASPRIDDATDTASQFNAMMDEADKTLGDMFDANGTLTDEDVTSDNDVTVKVDSVTSNRISLVANSYWMGHGAAHGNYGITYLHFLIDEGRALEASDIFKGKGWAKLLSDKAIALLDEQIDGGMWEDAKADMPKVVADPSRWSFTDQGLVLQFEPYEVTAYAFGAPTVTIPWDQLTDELVEGYDSKVLY